MSNKFLNNVENKFDNLKQKFQEISESTEIDDNIKSKFEDLHLDITLIRNKIESELKEKSGDVEELIDIKLDKLKENLIDKESLISNLKYRVESLIIVAIILQIITIIQISILWGYMPPNRPVRRDDIIKLEVRNQELSDDITKLAVRNQELSKMFEEANEKLAKVETNLIILNVFTSIFFLAFAAINLVAAVN